MATKTQELLTQVKDLCLLSSSDTSQDTALIRHMNQVQQQIYLARGSWRDLQASTTISTVASTAYVAVPSDMALLYTIRQTSSSPYGKLAYLDPQRFHEVVPQPTMYSEGKPTYYSWWGDRLYLYPIPDAVYTLTAYYYKRPTNMKIYSTGTAAHTALVVTGTSTYWLSGDNVDTNMFFSYTADVRSDGTYPWATVASVTANTTLGIAATYTGATASGTYIASSASSFGVDFDTLLVLGTAILFSGKNAQLTESMAWMKGEYDRMLTTLAKAQDRQPDWTPVARETERGGVMLGADAARFPFIREDL